MNKKIRIAYQVLFAMAALPLAGCADSNETDVAPPVIITPTYIHLSPTAPPRAQPELPATPDNARLQIWRAGYWDYDDGKFSWTSGTLIAKPSFTAVWSPDHWEKRQYGWAFVAGYWQ